METTRKMFGVDVKLRDVRGSRGELPKSERCARGFYDYDFKSGAEEFRCYGTPHTGAFGDAYERDDWKAVDPAACESCPEFEQAGFDFPLQVENILVEDFEVTPYPGAGTGSLVAVRPCADEFGGRTYLGVLVGEVPLQVGLKYDAASGELTVRQAYRNPLIVVPELSAVVYGCESWWRRIENNAELSEITDDQILSQPYMAALAEAAGVPRA